jgi:AcrR family transcriptional regulator
MTAAPHAGRNARLNRIGHVERPMLPQKFIDASKRERCAVAVCEIVHERGVEGMKTEELVRRARIARNTFYEIFDGRAGCLDFARRRALEVVLAPIEAAVRREKSYSTRIRGAIDGLLEAAVAEPLRAELCLIHSTGGRRDEAEGGRQAVVDVLTEAFGADTVAELSAHAVVTAVSGKLLRGEVVAIAEMRAELVNLVDP